MKNKIIKIIVWALILSTLALLVACNDGAGDIHTETEIVSTTETNIKGETETESDTTVTDETEEKAESDTKKETESLGETDTEACVHNYATKPEGHWKPACDICGKGEGRLQDHEIVEKVEDEGDLRLYYGKCSICNYVAYEREVEYNIRSYVAVSKLMAATQAGFSSVEQHFLDGVSFVSFESGSEDYPYVVAIENEGEDRSTGEYMVIKLRLVGYSDLSFSFSSFESYKLDANSKDDRGVACFSLKKLPSGWFVIVIDMTKAIKGETRGYIPDAGGEYFLKQLVISPENGKATEKNSLDVSYIMLCDTLNEAKEFVKNEKGYYLYGDIASDTSPESSGTVCAHSYTYDESSHKMKDCEACGEVGVTEQHTIGEIKYDGYVSYECMCGYSVKTKNIPESINLLITPGVMRDEADGHIAFSSSELIYGEEGEVYTRIWGKSKTDTGKDVTDEVKWYNPLKNNTEISGRYMIIKLRVGENSLGQTYLKMYISTKNKDATDERDGLTLPVTEDGEWHVIVVDLASCVGNSQGSTYIENSDGEYIAKFLQIRPFSGSIANEDDYTDIAYIGFADEVDSLIGLVEEELYYYMSDKGSGGYLKTDGSCITHGFSEVQNGNTYNYVCSSCGFEIGSKTVPESVGKFYGANEVSDSLIDTYFVLSRAKIYDGEAGIAFTRFLTAEDKMQPAYSRNDREGESRPVDVGDAAYLVVTVRQSKVSSLAIALGTTVGETSGNNGANLPISSMAEEEWVTFVIDIESVYGTKAWSADVSGSYTLTHFEITSYLDETGYLDIAFFAFCDGWDDIANVVDTDKVEYMTSNNLSETRTPDGDVVANGEK